MSTATGERLKHLTSSRDLLYQLPTDTFFELPGRPNVIYCIKDYTKDKIKGALEARGEMGFLFKAFETGQIGPRRLARMASAGEKPRNTTIHEWLDWTVTAAEAECDGDYVSHRVLLLFVPKLFDIVAKDVMPVPQKEEGEAGRAPC